MYDSAKPYTRWWWFSNAMRAEDIRAQLDWVKQNGFGGVEIAWVYPQPDQPRGVAFLSAEWSALVEHTKQYAGAIGLGCDFTCGTSWPFGGTFVPVHDASRTYEGLSKQRLEKSWELPEQGYLINHLDHTALERYAQHVGGGLAPALRGTPSALFCDSWEVLTEGLWTEGFGEAFRSRFGYGIEPLMPELNAHADERYDYRKLISDYALNEFYRPLTEVTHQLGAVSRVQCNGSPTDLLAAYAAVDVPESEAILFDPEFSTIPASAAALTAKPVVSTEAFTCLYGWVGYPGPGQYQGREQVADMKMLADGLFANGVNQIVWHGMPYNPPGAANRFYATVHVGPDSTFANDIPAFNAYMTQISNLMRQGHTRGEVAVYMPLEDAWMAHELLPDMRKPSAQYHWEMHYARLPRSLKGYRPLWVTLPFLRDAEVVDRQLRCGEHTFNTLYVNVEWLDADALSEISRLARAGLPVCLAQRPRQPGRMKNDAYAQEITRLYTLGNVSTDFGAVTTANRLVHGAELPDFWCRDDGDSLVFFFANPKSRRLRYPLWYGQSFTEKVEERNVEFYAFGRRMPYTLRFEPYQSLALSITRAGGIAAIDIPYTPPDPLAE